jgi:hypothetical protein
MALFSRFAISVLAKGLKNELSYLMMRCELVRIFDIYISSNHIVFTNIINLLNLKKNPIEKFVVIMFLCLFYISLWTGCKSDRESTPNISNIEISTEIVRFDSLLYTIQSKNDLTNIQQAYPAFFNLYFNQILGINHFDRIDTLLYQTSKMLNVETFTSLKKKIEKQYGNLDPIETQWDKAMKYYKYYFKEVTAPDLYTCVTEFSFASFIFPISETKDGIGVSLDMFLGDSVNYAMMAKLDPGFSSYNARTFNRDHLVKKAMDAVLEDLLPPVQKPEFIHHLIREGKKYYASDHILPFLSDTVIWEYTPEQWQWTQENEWNIYSFLISNDLIYSTQRSKYNKLIKPAPHTMDMPPEAPGRAAIFIGYQVVSEYMRRNPDVTMPALFEMDGLELFQAAKYKPRRE